MFECGLRRKESFFCAHCAVAVLLTNVPLPEGKRVACGGKKRGNRA